MKKYVYSFKEGSKELKKLLGGKGANLAEMTKLGLPVPRGFTVTTDACHKYYQDNKKLSDAIIKEIFKEIELLEKETGKKLGSNENPLLVSVRSGAAVSMPGMMDTVLNLGMNDEVATALVKKTYNPRFVFDSYRRFIMMYADVVEGYDKSQFERLMDAFKKEKNVLLDTDLNAKDMHEITHIFKRKYKEVSGKNFPSDPKEQLINSIEAVFASWNNERAIIYREMNNIDEAIGTAVNVQEMVYGNYGKGSGTGVAFTRNPATGENKLYGEYLINAQGEDVVAGVRTPALIKTLAKKMPAVYKEFDKLSHDMERHYKDMQDMEFTIEEGKLFLLQTRSGKRTSHAALKIAVDMVRERKITKKEALLRISPDELEQLLHPVFETKALKEALKIAEGLAASPGAATGALYFSAEDVKNAKAKGIKSILIRLETSPEDIEGMKEAEGILTVRGGMTSHAAVVARGMGRCCVSGCSEIEIDENKKTALINGKKYQEGDMISLDGSTGIVYDGLIETKEPEITGDFETFMKWATEFKRLKIKANAETKEDALKAMEFGAEGIGLCRTEHMFFDQKRIFEVRKMILASDYDERKKSIDKMQGYQERDFINLFRIVKEKPITVRYIDPPLHEFLPKEADEIKELAEALNVTQKTIKDKIEELKEFNPMMGHRGVRLSITYPEIAAMQTKALIKAAIKVREEGIKTNPEIMIPLVGDALELKYIKEIVTLEAENLIKKTDYSINYKIGTMIEVPRACVLADKIAKEAEFFSFGTNDLTQMTYGFSRDDASKFLTDYYKEGIFTSDPFTKLDQSGVGELMKMAIKKGLKTNKSLDLGICGEHGGEPSSIAFCHSIGLDYVSCSPYRVPIARLAAAQAKIKEELEF